MFKKVKKKLLGKNYQKFRLKKILFKIFKVKTLAFSFKNKKSIIGYPGPFHKNPGLRLLV